MRIYHSYEDLPPEAKNAAVAVGNFDGVHRGHQAVIGEAGLIAKAAGVPWAVLSFEPHPRLLFKPDQPPFRLTPLEEKARLIRELGVDYLLVLNFDKAFSERPAESFVHDILVGGIGAHHVVSGYDFVFGHGRKGNCELLLSMGAMEGYDFTCVKPVKDAWGVPYSSTRVRNCLINGDVRGAAAVLGGNFTISGEVIKGDARGRTIGFATANIDLGDYQRPAFGVYAIRATFNDGCKTVKHHGVANIGMRPTFEKHEALLEVHLFDFDGDLYGRTLQVELIDHIRPETKFSGLDELKTQIAEDCAKARALLGLA